MKNMTPQEVYEAITVEYEVGEFAKGRTINHMKLAAFLSQMLTQSNERNAPNL